MITTTTQYILDYGRLYIPDPKTRLESVRGENIGSTVAATNSRETFYIKRQALASPILYVEPYEYTATASLTLASSGDKVFQYDADLQSCTFAQAAICIRPNQHVTVFADYDYYKSLPYGYTDLELNEFLPISIAYLNNTFGFSYVFTVDNSGTNPTVQVTYSTEEDKEILAKGLAIVVRNSYVAEQMRQGLGVKFRGPMAAVDSTAQMKEYKKTTADLISSIEETVDKEAMSSGGSASAIDIYTETVVDG